MNLQKQAEKHSPLRDELLGRISKCMDIYSVPLDGPVILGLSGGKDSISLLFLLATLGIDVYPVVVDLGYPNFNAEEIADSVLIYGFKVKIISTNRPETLIQLSSRSRSLVTNNLAFLAAPGDATTCGSCSQVKRTLLLAEAVRKKAKWIVFGHHREDLLSTILKDYFAYTYHQAHGRYDYAIFRSFVHQSSVDTDLLERLVERKLAATMSIRLSLGGQVELFRPMAFVEESQTANCVREIGIRPFGSGCSHESFQNGQAPTKREIVHMILRERLLANPQMGEKLLAIALKSLDPQGRALFNPRASRLELLPGFDSSSAKH